MTIIYVSVPLRGKGRDQLAKAAYECQFGGHVSVPLRGKGRDQPDTRATKAYPLTKFPSPCGEKVGINSTC